MKDHDGEKRRPRRKYAPWRAEEDARLRRLCPQGRCFRWFAFEGLFPGRTAKQIRERWINQIDPALSRAPWTLAEDWRLFLCHAAFGGRWSTFRAHFPGRTDNQLKNRWNSALQSRRAAWDHKLAQLIEDLPPSPASPLVEDLLIAQLADQAPACAPNGKANRLSHQSTALVWNAEPSEEDRLGPDCTVSGRCDAGSDGEETRGLSGDKDAWSRVDFYAQLENVDQRSFI